MGIEQLQGTTYQGRESSQTPRRFPVSGPTSRSPNQRQRIVELLRERGSAGAIFEPCPKQPTDQIPPFFVGVSR
jgi:hypothetical protein